MRISIKNQLLFCCARAPHCPTSHVIVDLQKLHADYFPLCVVNITCNACRLSQCSKSLVIQRFFNVILSSETHRG